MITISDEKRLLNLNYFVIYLLLTPEEIDSYGDKLKNLNRHATLTRSLFSFEVVKKGDVPYNELPEDMLRYINNHNFNVLARLINQVHRVFCYGMEAISIDVETSEIIEQLQRFVNSVCIEDIKNLDVIMYRNTSTSREALRMYRGSNIVMELFETALERQKGETDEAKKLMPKLFPSTDTKISSALVGGALDNKLSDEIRKELYEREQPEAPPEQITITIKYIKKTKYGKSRKCLGFEINVDGDKIPVYFGSTDRTFLYAATLMALKEGRSPLTALHYMSLTAPYYYDTKQWLHQLFRTMNLNANFDEWCEKVKDSEGHKLYNAMGAIKRILWEALSPKHENAFYYCLLRNDDGRYKINIRKENIFIDKEITDRMQKR
jgi:hypothetical protein